MSEEPSGRVITSVERAADVLLLFTRASSEDLGVTEIASELALSKAVVHRILTSLASRGLVESIVSTRRYRLGPTALSLGVTYLDRIDLRALALPVLRQLCQRTRETATLSLRYGWERMYIEQVTPEREVKMTVALGRPFPLHAGSSSKAFLAFLPPNDQDQYLGGGDLDGLTEQTITDPAQLREELAKIRQRGFAVSHGERQVGAGSVAAPVFDHRDQPIAVVSVCGPLERFRDEAAAIGDALVEATHDLSRRLGYLGS
jgi:IclR family transcriptional regulator, acetate operon repressor